MHNRILSTGMSAIHLANTTLWPMNRDLVGLSVELKGL